MKHKARRGEQRALADMAQGRAENETLTRGEQNMTNNAENVKQKVDAGYFLVPLRQWILTGDLAKFVNDDFIAVLVVLISFENHKTRESFPTMIQLATLCGISKTSAIAAISELEKNHWLTQTFHPTRFGRGLRAVQHMKYERHKSGDNSGRCLHFERYIIMNGIWGAMSKSTRRLYLTLLALSSGIPTVTDEGAFATDRPEGRHVEPLHLDPSYLRTLSGLEDRTFRRSWEWLTRNKVIVAYEDTLHMPYEPSRFAPEIKERLSSIKSQLGQPTKKAKKLLDKRVPSFGHGTPKNRTRAPRKLDTAATKIGQPCTLTSL